MAKYRIKPKRDFGNRPFLINGRWVKSGFVVTDGFCNIMPAATWFETIPDAMRALRILVDCEFNAQKFWEAIYSDPVLQRK